MPGIELGVGNEVTPVHISGHSKAKKKHCGTRSGRRDSGGESGSWNLGLSYREEGIL